MNMELRESRSACRILILTPCKVITWKSEKNIIGVGIKGDLREIGSEVVG
jgi:hypothetical protein